MKPPGFGKRFENPSGMVERDVKSNIVADRMQNYMTGVSVYFPCKKIRLKEIASEAAVDQVIFRIAATDRGRNKVVNSKLTTRIVVGHVTVAAATVVT